MINQRYMPGILSYMQSNVGQQKVFSELTKDINSLLPTGRRMTTNEIANMMVYIKKKGDKEQIPIKIERKNHVYMFY